MLKQLIVAILTAALFAQGIVYADEPPQPVEVVNVDRVVLLEHLDDTTVGEKVAVATDEGVLAGEIVEKDADDLIIDTPLIQGGAERIVIPVRRIQAIGYTPPPQHSHPNLTAFLLVTTVVLSIVMVTLLRGLGGP